MFLDIVACLFVLSALGLRLLGYSGAFGWGTALDLKMQKIAHFMVPITLFFIALAVWNSYHG